MVKALSIAGVPCDLQINYVGECGRELVKLLDEDRTQKIGGEAILRIDNRSGLSGMIDISHAQRQLKQTHSSPHIPIPFFLDRTSASSHSRPLNNPSAHPATI